MQRIKIPMGLLDNAKMHALADMSEEYADGVSHVTTRQDIQYHFVDINDTPNLMRRLAEAGITTKEACGNVVRNVTCCPDSGVCRDEAFDVTPYCSSDGVFPTASSRRPEFRAQIQDRFLRLRRPRMRVGDDA